MWLDIRNIALTVLPTWGCILEPENRNYLLHTVGVAVKNFLKKKKQERKKERKKERKRKKERNYFQ